MRIVYEFCDQHIVQLCELYQSEWWTVGRSLEDTRTCVDGSQICIGVVDDGNDLLGFVRVITDYTFKALVLDLIVARPARRAGAGSTLLAAVNDHPDLQSVRHIELYCLPELLDFYGQHGFSANADGIVLMRQVKD